MSRTPAGKEGVNQLAEGAQVTFRRRAFAASEAAAHFDSLKAASPESPWQQQTLTVVGRRVLEPRLVRYQGSDPSLSYVYSGVTVVPQPFDATVLAVKQKVQELFPLAPDFNTCLLNYYRSGDDSLSWHDDQDLQRYGPNPTIVSVSFGAERAFQLRRKAAKTEKLEFSLGGGAVLLMSGACQAKWQHSVPKRANAPGQRINLTFRRVLPRRGAA